MAAYSKRRARRSTDHSHVLAQFHKLDPETNPTVRSGVLRSICAALEIHAQLEEEIFYPALRTAGIQTPVLDKSEPEHDAMRRLIERVRAAGTDGEQPDLVKAAPGKTALATVGVLVAGTMRVNRMRRKRDHLV